jgi:hypothetical protein
MPRTRSRLILLGTTLVLSACGAVAPATAPTTATNKLAAQRDVAKLLGLAGLPPGATRLTAEPPGDRGLLGKPYSEPSIANVVDRHGFWRVSEPLNAVTAFVKTHRPTGSRWSGTAHAGGPGVRENEELTFSFRRSAAR